MSKTTTIARMRPDGTVVAIGRVDDKRRDFSLSHLSTLAALLSGRQSLAAN
jgi:hypothetical protein